MTIQRDPVHPYNLRNLAHGNVALGHELEARSSFGPTSTAFRPPLRPSVLPAPVPYQVQLELGQGSKEREDEIAGGRCGIDVLLQGGPRSCRLVISATSSLRLRPRLTSRHTTRVSPIRT